MPERNADLPPGKNIEFRIGINVGDIIVDGDDIFGDGVNVAARLESISEPGGICKLRSLPSTGITRLQWYYEPLRHPEAPGLSLTGLRLVVADRALGLPVFRALSLCTCCRHYPGAASGTYHFAHFIQT